MKRAVFAVLAACMLGGCVSFLEDAYDERARQECEQTAPRSGVGACYDRVEQDRRERRED